MAQRLKTDWILFFTTLLMMTFGLVMVYSASSPIAELRYQQTGWYFFVRQMFWGVFGAAVLMYLKHVDYRRLRRPSVAFACLGVVLALLVVAYFRDPSVHRWIRIGPGGLQPSELAKPALILFLAYFLSVRPEGINERRTLLPVGLVVGMLAVIVGLGDLGTALVLVLTAAVLFFIAGLERRYFVAAALLLTLFATAAVLSKPYRLSRVIGFLDPEGTRLDRLDPSGRVKEYANSSLSTRDTSYQQRQSKLAVGSGGVLGRGLMESHQKLLFLPEAHTDFIYAVVGEELGLVGCLAVLAGFGVILWRGMRLFQIAADDFGRYLALGVTASILLQALINISVVLDLGPTKGFPLPLISYGGSSLLSTLASMGLLLSVSEQAG